MVITDLTELSSGRYKVYVDDEFAFVLYKSELGKYRLAVGDDLLKEINEEIMNEVLPKRARLRTMNLLQKRQYTERQLIDKLKEGLYPKAIIEDAISYVKSFGYLNDLQYALDYITYHENSRAKKRLIYDLRQKGISSETIKQAFEQWRSLGGDQNEVEMIQSILVKKNYLSDSEPKDKQKICAFLLRKGFSMENVNKVLNGLDSFT